MNIVILYSKMTIIIVYPTLNNLGGSENNFGKLATSNYKTYRGPVP